MIPLRLAAFTALFAAASPLLAQNFTITTLAGQPGASGSVDATGAAARFNQPVAVAVDADGTLYVGEANNATVRKVSPAGAVSTLAALPAAATGLAVDSVKNVYVADAFSHVIRKVTPAGVVSIFAGQAGTPGSADGPAASARFNAPEGLAFDAAGNLFVADASNHTLRKITPAGNVSTFAGLAGISGASNGIGSAARFNRPVGIVFDASGNLYVADADNRLVRKVTPSAAVTSLAGYPWSDIGNVDGMGETARFGRPRGITLDATGALVVADSTNHTLRRVTTGGVVTTIAGAAGVSGSADGAPSTARFQLPLGIVAGASGNLYVADSGNHTLRKAEFLAPPTITTQPANRNLAAGQDATFTVGATSAHTITYQWQRSAVGTTTFVNLSDGAPFTGTHGPTLTVASVAPAMSGDQFRCILENGSGSTVVTSVATLFVNSQPTITSAATATFYSGIAGSFTVTATGSPAPTFSVSSGALPSWATLNAATGAISGTPTSTAGSPFSFTLSAANGVGTAATQNFTLHVQAAPVVPTITSMPARRQLVINGGTLNFTVTASGTEPLNYQWKRNGFPVAGATTATFSTTASARDNGYYQLVVSNGAGAVTSPGVFVNVTYGATQVIPWGVESPVPAGLSNAIAVAAGGSHGLALLANGVPVAWGTSNNEGQLSVPGGLGDVVRVSAGYYHNLALRSDGTVAAWGYNSSGQTTIPAGLTGVVSIAAGNSHSLALKGDGTVVGWGSNSSSQSTPPAGLNNVVAIAASSEHSLALKADGTVVMWGYTGGYTVPASLSNVVAIAAGWSSGTGVAVRGDGTVAVFGSSSWVGNVPASLSGVVSAALSQYQGAALKNDGTVVVWGDNYSSPVALPANTRSVIAISAHSSYRFALRDASSDLAPSIVTSPAHVSANLGQRAMFSVTASAGTAALNYQWHRNGTAITGATNASLGVDATNDSAGTYHVVVSNSLGSATSAAASLTINASPVLSATAGGRYPLALGQSLTLSLASSISAGASVQWRHNGLPIPGATSRTFAITNATPAHGGYYQAIYNDGSGATTTAAVFVPVALSATQVLAVGGSSYYGEGNVPAGLTNVVAISARSSNAIALRADGTVSQWGGSSYGQPPAGLGNVAAVSVGSGYTLALKGDGTVTAWAESTGNSALAVPADLANVVAVAAGFSHCLALKNDGTVVGWGSSVAATSIPAGLNNVIAIAAGSGFSVALRADGTVVAWGANSNGQSNVPAGLGGVVAIAAGGSFGLALKNDGTVVSWGTTDSYSSTISVPVGLNDVKAIAAADSHALALKSNGQVIAWGGVTPAVAQSVGAARQVFASAGGYNGFTVLARDASQDVAPVIVTQPAAVSAFTKQTVTFSVGATGGTTALNYQWRKNGVTIAGATAPTYVVPNLVTAQAGTFDVLVSNYLGTIGSNAVALTVNAAAGATTSPTSRHVVNAGQSVTFTGSSPMPGTLTYQWRRNGVPIAGATAAQYSIASATWNHGGAYDLLVANAAGPAASAPIFFGVTSTLQVRAGGENGAGQSAVPADLGGVLRVAAGQGHSLALKPDGTVAAWGSNNYGQCNVPADLSDVVAIAAGSGFSVALTADGGVRAWGYINFAPAAARDVVAIAAYSYGSYILALRADGTVVEWDSSGLRNPQPTVSGVISIAAGGNNAIALRADGTVIPFVGSSSPTPVPDSLSGVVAISAGSSHFLALKNDGTVAAWGSNNYQNQLNVPAGLTNVAAVVAGYDVSFALKPNGDVVTWGSLSSVGNGVLGISPVRDLALSSSHWVALRDPVNDAAPTITAQPVAQNATAGESVTLSVTATGVPPPTFQWYRNGVAFVGATSSSLVFPSVGIENAGNYSVTVSNGVGSITSNEVALVVGPAAGQRAFVTSSVHANTGPAALSGTFTVEGASSKFMLIRAVGPALATFGVTGVLGNPQLEITTAGGALVAANDDWGSAANATQVQTTSAQVGAFALGAGSKDAAVLRSFLPGTYHARVTGVAGAAGVAMLEIYDADSAPRLVYVATSAFAGVGDDAFVQGFGLAGVTSGRTYLIRALGPTLGGVGALADPTLAIYNSASVEVAANDNWGGVAALATAANTVGAMALAADSKDAALSFTPAAGGAYTLHVRGAGGATGRVLVEIFEVDAQRATTMAPAIVAQPRSASVLAGEPVAFSVVAIGKPAPAFQWRKNGTPIDGATNAKLTFGAAQAADAADYTVIVTSGSSSATSQPATLSLVAHTATHAVVGHGYVAGATVRITNTLTYSGTASSLGWQVTLPAGWSFASGDGAQGDVKPAVGATGTLEWAWSTPPPTPVTFTYTLNVPAGETTTRTLSGNAIVRLGANPQSAPIAPALLSVPAAATTHSGDTRGATTGTPPDLRIDLFELTRVIELYNTRHGTVRTGSYDVQNGTEDGFVPVPDRAVGAAVSLARYHTADSNRDGQISLFELTRVIELYNYRSGTTRTGEYHVQAGTEDGFAPGP